MIHPDYSCYTVVGEFMGSTIWEHRVVSKDHKRAIVISYSPDVKRITPPVYHFHDPDGADGFPDDCDVVDSPCVANIGLLDIFDIGAMNQDHSGETDPGLKFWTMMIRRLDNYPKEAKTNDCIHEDSRPDSDTQVQERAARDGSGQDISADEARTESDVRTDCKDLQREDGPSNGNGGYWEESSGTTRVLN